jgi:hypothetical protein
VGSAQRLQQAVACIVGQLGTSGCSFGQPLEAARRALDPRHGAGAGLVRDEALLAVLVLTNLDDCSAANPALFDPRDSHLTDPMGPLSLFRCFEFGIACDVNDRWNLGPRKDCRPAGDWLYRIEGYAAFFRGLKPPGHVLFGAITGPTDRIEVGRQDDMPTLRDSCRSPAGLAAPAIRIEALTDALAPHSQFSSICAQSHAPALRAFGQKILASLAR